MRDNHRVSEVDECVNCRGDALRCLECEEELSAMSAREPLSLTAWDWVKIVVGAVLAGLLFWVMAAGWPLLSVSGGAR